MVIELNGKLVWLYPDGTRQPYIPEKAEQTGAGS
jgi:hypothetical protein